MRLDKLKKELKKITVSKKLQDEMDNINKFGEKYDK